MASTNSTIAAAFIGTKLPPTQPHPRACLGLISSVRTSPKATCWQALGCTCRDIDRQGPRPAFGFERAPRRRLRAACLARKARSTPASVHGRTRGARCSPGVWRLQASEQQTSRQRVRSWYRNKTAAHAPLA
jgi:hypothetical protein